MTSRSILLATLATFCGAATLFLAAGTAKAVTIITSSPVAVTFTAAGQSCDQAYHQTTTTTSQPTLEFQSAYDGCANFSVVFLADGVQVFSSAPLAPFASTGTFNAGPVAPGNHALEVRAVGVAGGCDDGTLHAWAGRFTVTTNDDPPPPPRTGPTSPEQCRQGGWRSFTSPSFKNQGQCVDFVEHIRRGDPTPARRDDREHERED